jgi:hypothetical protein
MSDVAAVESKQGSAEEMADKSADAAAENAGEEAGDEGEDAAAAEGEGEATPKKAPRVRKPKVSAPVTPSAAAAAAPSAGVSSRGRERKAVVAYVPDAVSKVQLEWIPAEAGAGTELGEIENVKRRMDSIHAVDEVLKAAFVACYPERKGGNTKDVIKKHLREFSGYTPAVRQQDERTRALSAHVRAGLLYSHFCFSRTASVGEGG